jgi:hypothetical protein
LDDPATKRFRSDTLESTTTDSVVVVDRDGEKLGDIEPIFCLALTTAVCGFGIGD